MLYELRQYRTFPGRRDELVALMDSAIIPFQRSYGVHVLGAFVAEDDPDLYVWIRAFDDAESRDRITAAVYGSDRWRGEFDGPIRELIDFDRVRVTTLSATPEGVVP